MNEAVKTYYEKQSEVLLPALKKRNFDAMYFATLEECKTYLFSMMEEGSTIGFGGSVTFEKEANLYEELKTKKYHLIDRYDTSLDQKTIKSMTINADYFFMSTNALTMDGQLVNIDGTGSRLAYMIYGPEHVVILVGMNKVVKSLDDALSRARNIAAPKNAIRLKKNTPCTLKGMCMDCLSPDCICDNIVITRASKTPSRIKVFLIGEELGY